MTDFMYKSFAAMRSLDTFGKTDASREQIWKSNCCGNSAPRVHVENYMEAYGTSVCPFCDTPFHGTRPSVKKSISFESAVENQFERQGQWTWTDVDWATPQENTLAAPRRDENTWTQIKIDLTDDSSSDENTDK